MTAYYNELDPFAAAWLRELIKAGHIAPGEVDERSIEDVRPSELRRFTQCHFFAGIGVWSYALRMAGWPDDRPVWTGSCPCQPFSAAGKRGGTSDERHLWPAFYHLIRECSPRNVFGEQVASKDGLAWFSTVSTDMEAAGYAIGGVDLCSAGFGAPHIRQRLYFVGARPVDNTADSRHNGTRERDGGPSLRATRSEQSGAVGSGMADSQHPERRPEREANGDAHRWYGLGRSGDVDGGLADNNNNTRLEGRELSSESSAELASGPSGLANGLAEPEQFTGRQERTNSGRGDKGSGTQGLEQRPLHGGLVNGFWNQAEWIFCRDGKYRPIEPGTSPLATGVTNRVGKLRGFGNALTSEVAKGFVESYLEVERGM